MPAGRPRAHHQLRHRARPGPRPAPAPCRLRAGDEGSSWLHVSAGLGTNPLRPLPGRVPSRGHPDDAGPRFLSSLAPAFLPAPGCRWCGTSERGVPACPSLMIDLHRVPRRLRRRGRLARPVGHGRPGLLRVARRAGGAHHADGGDHLPADVRAWREEEPEAYRRSWRRWRRSSSRPRSPRPARWPNTRARGGRPGRGRPHPEARTVPLPLRTLGSLTLARSLLVAASRRPVPPRRLPA